MPPTSPSVPALTPTAPSERIAVLDILRGFALLGILVINMQGFNTPWAMWPSGEEWFPARIDRAAEWAVNFFGSGKFNSTFSFLFGLGLTLQMERAAAKNRSFVPLYLRRLLALMAFGVAHSLLLWSGDVLQVYAVIGLLLLAARRLPDRAIFAVIALCLLAPIARQTYAVATNEKPKHPPAYYSALAREHLQAFQQGTYPQMVQARVQKMRVGYAEEGFGWFYVSMSVTMLLGFMAGRHRMVQTLPEWLPRIRRWTWWCLGLGLACALAFATAASFADRTKPTLLGLVAGVGYELNRPLLCVFYLCAIVLLTQREGWTGRLAPLAAVGRMPLTNYLMQSLLCKALFDGWGFGLFGKVGPAAGLLVAAGVFAVQVAYSGWWVRRYAYGPMEWLWRLVTYGRAPAMRPVARAAAA